MSKIRLAILTGAIGVGLYGYGYMKEQNKINNIMKYEKPLFICKGNLFMRKYNIEDGFWGSFFPKKILRITNADPESENIDIVLQNYKRIGCVSAMNYYRSNTKREHQHYTTIEDFLSSEKIQSADTMQVLNKVCIKPPRDIFVNKLTCERKSQYWYPILIYKANDTYYVVSDIK